MFWRSSIPCLDHSISPTAIFRTIRAVVIDAIYRVRWSWLRTHIGEEIFKRILPPIANCDASAAIVFPIRTGLISASMAETAPRKPFRRYFVLAGHAVRSSARDYLFSSQTTAARTMSIAKSRTIDALKRLAVALANPQASGISFNNGPPTEPTANHVYKCWHNMKFTMASV